MKRTRYVARYLYPGSFFPEDLTREIEEPTFVAAAAAAPEGEGWCAKDRWYAVEVTAIVEKRFTSEDGDEAWVRECDSKAGAWVIGERVHVDDPRLAGDEFRILRANIAANTKDGYAVKTRRGNWQMADSYTEVVPESLVART